MVKSVPASAAGAGLRAVFRTHVQRWGFDAELAEGVSQGLLGNRELIQLVGQRLSQLEDVLEALLVISQQLESRLQVQVHSPGSSTQLLRQNLPGALRRPESQSDPFIDRISDG